VSAADDGADGVLADRDLIDRAQRGDRKAFEEIVARHQPAVYGYLRSRLFEASDAEDLVQEAFLRFYRELGRFDGSAAVRPWILGIARNLLRENLRRIRRRREVAWTRLCLDLDELVEGLPESVDEALGHLPGCLDSLGGNARQALDLHYGQKLRLADIGKRLHRSEGAVKLLVFRARQALRHCLDSKAHGSKV
jgi:RNA polymerase sigma-70 factor, ECF subfamily